MWPFKKKKNKGIKLALGESIGIGFATSWSKYKDEVMIMTNNGPIILDEKSELFIEVTADNIDPIKIQVVPDFRNKTINFVEVIDPNIKKKFTNKDSPRLTFTGDIVRERHITISDYMKNWDQNIEIFEKLVKRSMIIRNVFIPVNIILIFWNSYSFIFITNSNTLRYVNLVAVLLCSYTIYHIYNYHKKLYRDYLRYKDIREKSFGIVKEK